jgi:hypothetical protein
MQGTPLTKAAPTISAIDQEEIGLRKDATLTVTIGRRMMDGTEMQEKVWTWFKADVLVAVRHASLSDDGTDMFTYEAKQSHFLGTEEQAYCVFSISGPFAVAHLREDLRRLALRYHQSSIGLSVGIGSLIEG